MPRITVDPSALRHGVWGNSWRQWGEQRPRAKVLARYACIPVSPPLAPSPDPFETSMSALGSCAGLIMGAFLALYSVLAGLQTGMLFAALGIRGDSYRCAPPPPPPACCCCSSSSSGCGCGSRCWAHARAAVPCGRARGLHFVPAEA